MSCKYFLPSAGCLFIILIVSSDARKSLILIMSNLSICFSFCCVGFWCRIEESHAKSNVTKIYPYCFLMRALALTFRSLFHLLFACSVKQGCNFILLHVNGQLSQKHLLKRLFFLTELFQHSCQNHLTINARVYF